MDNAEVKALTLQGYSIRQVAEALGVTKYQVEKSILALKATGQLSGSAPDIRPDTAVSSSGHWSDTRPDSNKGMSGQGIELRTASALVSKTPLNSQKPSRLNGNLTAYEEDFILRHHRTRHTSTEIKKALEASIPGHFISVYDIEKLIQGYELELRQVHPVIQEQTALAEQVSNRIAFAPSISPAASAVEKRSEETETDEEDEDQEEEESENSSLQTLAWVVGGIALAAAVFNNSSPTRPVAPKKTSEGLDGLAEFYREKAKK